MRSILTMTMVVFVCCSAVAQDQATSPNHEALKELDYFIGDWDGKGKVSTESDLFAGESFTIRWSVEWAMNKTAIEAKWTVKLAKGAEVDGQGIWYFDQANKAIKTFGINAMGGHTHGTMHKQGNKVIDKVTGVDPQGKQTSSVNINTMVDENTLVFQITESTAGGEARPDFRIDYRRVVNK